MAKSNKKVTKESEDIKAPEFGTFKNVTKRNIFTTAGRIMADEKLELAISEGSNTTGLELV